MKFISGGSCADYIDRDVQVNNEATHSVTKYWPLELWTGSQDELRLAHQRMEKERDYQNRKRKVHLETFYPAKFFLVCNERSSLTRFEPR